MDTKTAGIVWFTGFSGAGKTTLATAVAERLRLDNKRVYLLDGDTLRTGLCSDLRFSDADRTENIRRAGEVAKLFMEEGYIVLCTFISPFIADRDIVRSRCPAGAFHEIHVSTPLAVCEQRDPKGLYQKARSGVIPHFTGINSPYQPPLQPDLEIDTSAYTLNQSCDLVVDYLKQTLFIPSGEI